MSTAWLSLPANWRLEDVRAGLNVYITLLSILTSYAFVRLCWLLAVKRISKGHKIPLHSLLTLGNLGEAFDITLLLNRRLITARYATIFAQVIVVICFSTTAIFSGPIARYSSRSGVVVREKSVNGTMASRSFSDRTWDWPGINSTMTRLKQASFPPDQLLDWLPSNEVNWVFDSSQWNSTWSMKCQSTPRMNVTLNSNQQCKNGIFDGLVGSDRILADNKDFLVMRNWMYVEMAERPLRDYFEIWYSYNGTDHDDKLQINRTVHFTLAAVVLQGVVKPQPNIQPLCEWGTGPVQNSFYSKIECQVHQQAISNTTIFNTAFPDSSVVDFPTLVHQHYVGDFRKQSFNNLAILVPDPDELIRLYQTAFILKDTMRPFPVSRLMNVEISVAQLSTAFMGVTLLIAVLILISLTYHGIYVIRHRDVTSVTPESKLEWIMQSIQPKDPLSHASTYSRGMRRPITVANIEATRGVPRSSRMRMEFEAATYGGAPESTAYPLSASPQFDHPKASTASYTDLSAYQTPDLSEGSPEIRYGMPRVASRDRSPMLGRDPYAENQRLISSR